MRHDYENLVPRVVRALLFYIFRNMKMRAIPSSRILASSGLTTAELVPVLEWLDSRNLLFVKENKCKLKKHVRIELRRFIETWYRKKFPIKANAMRNRSRGISVATQRTAFATLRQYVSNIKKEKSARRGAHVERLNLRENKGFLERNFCKVSKLENKLNLGLKKKAKSIAKTIDYHHCHAVDCVVKTKPEMLMCGPHWRMVSKANQVAVWKNYRVGQCNDKRPNRAWFTAADLAIREVGIKEGKIDPFAGKIEVEDVIFHVPNKDIFEFLAKYPSRKELELAAKMFSFYQAAKFAKTSRFAKPEIHSWEETTETEKICFIKAVRTAKKAKRSVKDYLAGIFWWYSRFGKDWKAKNGQTIIPQPQQLFGEQALAKVEEHTTSREVDEFREGSDRKIHKGFTRESRKLKALAQITGLDPKAILKASPKEFSVEFLKYKRVWDFVRDVVVNSDD